MLPTLQPRLRHCNDGQIEVGKPLREPKHTSIASQACDFQRLSNLLTMWWLNKMKVVPAIK